jgi:hypothetical protein
VILTDQIEPLSKNIVDISMQTANRITRKGMIHEMTLDRYSGCQVIAPVSGTVDRMKDFDTGVF